MLVSEPVAGLPGADVAVAATDTAERRRRRVSLEFWLPATGLIFIVLLCMVGPDVLPVHLTTSAILSLASNLPPLSKGHLLGTDPIGNDIFSRILYGGRISLEVGFGAQALGFVLGSSVGMIAGFVGGVVDNVLMRVMDLLLAFPSLVLALMVAAFLGNGEMNVIYAIAFFTVPATSRIARAQALRVRERDFVLVSQIGGARRRWIILRHIAPNVYPSMVTFFCLGVGYSILAEAGLSFLGIGIPPTTPSWGNMISTGEPFLSSDPWLVFVPAIFLCFTILCLNLLGDAFRSRLSSS